MSLPELFVQLSFRCHRIEPDGERCDACGDQIFRSGVGIFTAVGETELKRGPVCVVCDSCADIAELEIEPSP